MSGTRVGVAGTAAEPTAQILACPLQCLSIFDETSNPIQGRESGLRVVYVNRHFEFTPTVIRERPHIQLKTGLL